VLTSRFVLPRGVIVAAFLWVTPGSAPAAEPDNAQAAKEFDAGQSAYDSGKFGEALRHYLASYRLGHDSAVLFSVGECYRHLKNYSKAKTYYLRYLAEVRNAPYEPLIRDLVKELDARIAESRTTSPPASPPGEPTPPVTASSPKEKPAAPAVDEKPVASEPEVPPAPTEAPPIAVVAPASPGPDVPVAPVITPAASPVFDPNLEAVRPAPPPVPPSLFTRWWFWGAVGAAVAGGSVATYFILKHPGRTPTLGTVTAE
jgi:hypothetical protein